MSIKNGSIVRENLAKILEEQKSYDEAINIYSSITESADKDEIWFGKLSLARLYALSGNVSKAKELAEESEKLFNSSKTTELSVDYPWLLGRYLSAVEEYPEALVKLSEAMAYMKKFDWFKSACAQIDRANCYSKLGKLKQAEQDIKAVEKYFVECPYLLAKAKPTLALLKYSEDNLVKDKWALIIGISEFADKRIPTLRYAAKDAQDLQKFLVEKAGFKADHVHLIENKDATRQRVL